MYHLALVLKELNRDQEALKLMEECVQLQTRILGFDHRYTVSSFEELTRWQLEKVDI
jgi:hypothetical protein